MEKKLTDSKLLILLSAIIALDMAFLPYVLITGKTREYDLSQTKDQIDDHIDMTVSDMTDISFLNIQKCTFSPEKRSFPQMRQALSTAVCNALLLHISS